MKRPVYSNQQPPPAAEGGPWVRCGRSDYAVALQVAQLALLLAAVILLGLIAAAGNDMKSANAKLVADIRQTGVLDAMADMARSEPALMEEVMSAAAGAAEDEGEFLDLLQRLRGKQRD